jgi:hypothetical protein
MSGAIRLYGETSGFVELKAPAVADDNTIDIGLIPTIDTAPSDGQVLTWNASLSKWEAKDAKMKEKRIARFTGNGTWTVPAGVTYAIAHMVGGGGGVGTGDTGGNGAASSVDFASGLVSAAGGQRGHAASAMVGGNSTAGGANSGLPATFSSSIPSGVAGFSSSGGNPGARVTAGASVTPAASISVVVGAGGTAGTSGSAGGSGYVFIEYYEEV